MNFDLVKLDAKDEMMLKKYKLFYYKNARENPKNSSIKKENFDTQIKKVLNNKLLEIYLAENKDNVIAEFQTMQKQFLNGTYLNLKVSFLKDTEQKRVNHFIEANVKNQLNSKLKLIFIIEKNFVYDHLINLGFKRRNSFMDFELNTKNIDTPLLDKYIKNIDLTRYGLKDGFYGNPDFKIVEKIAAFKTELHENMICEDKHMAIVFSAKRKMKQIEAAKKQNKINLFYLLFKKSQLVGMSEVMLYQQSTKRVNQYMTGIKKEFTKKGLASFMKAKMYTHLLKEFPSVETIYTNCFSTNAPMIKINKWLGFELYTITHELVYE